MKHNVPVQSLIDHIKTAIDVDPWAKEMAHSWGFFCADGKRK
jgi:hypothetical protein